MEILEIILYYVSMWGPALVSILGIAATVFMSIGKVVKAIQEWKTSNENGATAAEKLHTDMKQLITENKHLQAYNQKLLEEITRISGYDINLEDPGDESK